MEGKNRIKIYGILFKPLKCRDYSPGTRSAQQSFLVYDPSTVRGKQDNLAWMNAPEFARSYTRSILYVVARYG